LCLITRSRSWGKILLPSRLRSLLWRNRLKIWILSWWSSILWMPTLVLWSTTFSKGRLTWWKLSLKIGPR
jgi:hypothetical protein